MKKLVVNDKYNGKKLSKFILDNVSTLNFNKFCMVVNGNRLFGGISCWSGCTGTD